MVEHLIMVPLGRIPSGRAFVNMDLGPSSQSQLPAALLHRSKNQKSLRTLSTAPISSGQLSTTLSAKKRASRSLTNSNPASNIAHFTWRIAKASGQNGPDALLAGDPTQCATDISTSANPNITEDIASVRLIDSGVLARLFLVRMNGRNLAGASAKPIGDAASKAMSTTSRSTGTKTKPFFAKETVGLLPH